VIRAVLLTSTRLGCRAAAALAGLPVLSGLTLVTAPPCRRRLSLFEKARDAWRYGGPPGVLRAATQRLRHEPLAAERLANAAADLCPALPHIRVADFHAPEAVERIAALGADLGITCGTYRLKPSLYGVPRLGSINLHFGWTPEYRGSSPAFWEMYDGVSSVGATVHWISPHQDAGDILLQRRIRLDIAPEGDPLEYIADFQRDTLQPLGFRLLAEAVTRLAYGQAQARPQDRARGRTRRRATWRDKQELRRRVAARRAPTVG
jgi:methionyl-tRNA formyltransferase